MTGAGYSHRAFLQLLVVFHLHTQSTCRTNRISTAVQLLCAFVKCHEDSQTNQGLASMPYHTTSWQQLLRRLTAIL